MVHAPGRACATSAATDGTSLATVRPVDIDHTPARTSCDFSRPLHLSTVSRQFAQTTQAKRSMLRPVVDPALPNTLHQLPQHPARSSSLPSAPTRLESSLPPRHFSAQCSLSRLVRLPVPTSTSGARTGPAELVDVALALLDPPRDSEFAGRPAALPRSSAAIDLNLGRRSSIPALALSGSSPSKRTRHAVPPAWSCLGCRRRCRAAAAGVASSLRLDSALAFARGQESRSAAYLARGRPGWAYEGPVRLQGL